MQTGVLRPHRRLRLPLRKVRGAVNSRWTALMLAMLAIDAALAWLTRNEKPEEETEEV